MVGRRSTLPLKLQEAGKDDLGMPAVCMLSAVVCETHYCMCMYTVIFMCVYNNIIVHNTSIRYNYIMTDYLVLFKIDKSDAASLFHSLVTSLCHKAYFLKYCNLLVVAWVRSTFLH